MIFTDFMTKDQAITEAVKLLKEKQSGNLSDDEFSSQIESLAAGIGISPNSRLVKLAELRINNVQAPKQRTQKQDLAVNFTAPPSQARDETPKVGPFSLIKEGVSDEDGGLVFSDLPPGERFVIINLPSNGVSYGPQPDAIMGGGTVRRTFTAVATFFPGQAQIPLSKGPVGPVPDALLIDTKIHPVIRTGKAQEPSETQKEGEDLAGEDVPS